MDAFSIRLKLLEDILNKKFDALESILEMTKTPDRFELSEKQAQIDQVILCDDVFSRVFSELESFEEKASQYPEQIENLKSLITSVMDLDLKIRYQEATPVPSGPRFLQTTPTQAQKTDMAKKYSAFKKPK